MELRRIQDVQSESGKTLRLTFDDGATGLIDFEPLARHGGVYSPLADEALFGKFRLERGGRVLAWPEDVEFCADALWQAVARGIGIDQMESAGRSVR